MTREAADLGAMVGLLQVLDGFGRWADVSGVAGVQPSAGTHEGFGGPAYYTALRPASWRIGHHRRCRAKPQGGLGSVCTCVLLDVGGVNLNPPCRAGR